ncbi:MAG TPA: FAD-dependent thymidylate synthase [Actinomycetota bacterium]|nr:FAD-dependent thymidylate synthase [Actinomycetota bacterium]
MDDPIWFVREEFTPDERAILAPHFSDLDGPVFALTNLPEVVKGALFARYSRSAKSLRRLFLDEFAEAAGGAASGVGVGRAEELYRRVFVEYGDDSVAQLGGVHLACEQASQPLAKVLEWGRLAAYLEQSTRYVPYDDRPGGRFRYVVPPEIASAPGDLATRYTRSVDAAFETYSKWLGPLQDLYRSWFPQDPGDSDFVYRSSIRAKACDTLRGLLPAATRTNVGIYATGQSYEQLLIRMRSNPMAEVRAYADMMLVELRKVIPAFLTRVDRPDRGGEWSEYLASTREGTASAAAEVLGVVEAGATAVPDDAGVEVDMTDHDPDGETKIVAAALYAATNRSDRELLEEARKLSASERASVLAAYVGTRRNRRHKPGRAFERTSYRFDVLCDYGAFRDLQRHRLLTLEWQRLSTEHGYSVPEELEELGAAADWRRVMQESDSLHTDLHAAGLGEAAHYAVAMAYRVRFYLEMNAREAMHLIELRSAPQGHPTYRLVAQRMHELIGDVHPAVAGAMTFADNTPVELGRLAAERRSEARRQDAES